LDILRLNLVKIIMATAKYVISDRVKQSPYYFCFEDCFIGNKIYSYCVSSFVPLLEPTNPPNRDFDGDFLSFDTTDWSP